MLLLQLFKTELPTHAHAGPHRILHTAQVEQQSGFAAATVGLPQSIWWTWHEAPSQMRFWHLPTV